MEADRRGEASPQALLPTAGHRQRCAGLLVHRCADTPGRRSPWTGPPDTAPRLSFMMAGVCALPFTLDLPFMMAGVCALPCLGDAAAAKVAQQAQRKPVSGLAPRRT